MTEGTENLLRLKERVEIAVELGESYYREFKSAWEGPPKDKKPPNKSFIVALFNRHIPKNNGA